MQGRSRILRLTALGVAAAALLATSAVSASAQMGPRGQGMGRDFRGGRFAGRGQARDAFEQLKLTDAQKDKLHAIRRSAPAALMPKRQAVMEARMDLRDLLAKDEASAADVRRAHDKLMHARDELQTAAFDLRIQMREVLTPEQRRELKDLRSHTSRRFDAPGFRRGPNRGGDGPDRGGDGLDDGDEFDF